MYKQEIGDKKEKIMQTGCSKFALPSANGKKLESGLRAQHFVRMCGTKYYWGLLCANFVVRSSTGEFFVQACVVQSNTEKWFVQAW